MLTACFCQCILNYTFCKSNEVNLLFSLVFSFLTAKIYINHFNLIIYDAIQNAPGSTVHPLIAFLTVLLSPCKIRNHV